MDLELVNSVGSKMGFISEMRIEDEVKVSLKKWAYAMTAVIFAAVQRAGTKRGERENNRGRYLGRPKQQCLNMAYYHVFNWPKRIKA